MKILVILTILAVLFLTTESREYKYHLTLKPNVFDVYWSVNTTNLHKTFYIKFVAKTTGWAALGWTKKPEGRHMLQYDIALGGVRNGNDKYLKDYYSSTEYQPDLDPSNLQSLVLTNATEADGFTTIEFNRHANTLDNANDVPFENGTKMWLMWAIAPTDATNPTTFVKHSDKDYTKVAYNMFTGEQFEASTTPSTVPSTTSKPSGTGATTPTSVASTVPSTTSKPSGTGATTPTSVASTVPSTTSKPSGTGATTPQSVAINIISSILVVVLLQPSTFLMLY